MTDEELNALVKRLDDMSDLSRDHAAGLLDLGHKVAVNQAITAITTLRAQLAEARAELENANKIMDDWTTLHRVIADIRDASGLGSRPMLSDLATEIGRSLATSNARADRAEAERAVHEWQPIETAPKGGARIMLWRGATSCGKWSEMVIAEWLETAWCWPDSRENPSTHGEWTEDELLEGYADSKSFTHWRPLPVPPDHPQPHDRTALDAVIRAAKVEAWREAAYIAANACLVPPDGGNPTEYERLVCEEAYRRILALIEREGV